MTTIGYGDYSPRTFPGRFIITLTAIWGVFLVSILVVALNNTLMYHEFIHSQARNLGKQVFKRNQTTASTQNPL